MVGVATRQNQIKEHNNAKKEKYEDTLTDIVPFLFKQPLTDTDKDYLLKANNRWKGYLFLNPIKKYGNIPIFNDNPFEDTIKEGRDKVSFEEITFPVIVFAIKVQKSRLNRAPGDDRCEIYAYNQTEYTMFNPYIDTGKIKKLLIEPVTIQPTFDELVKTIEEERQFKMQQELESLRQEQNEPIRSPTTFVPTLRKQLENMGINTNPNQNIISTVSPSEPNRNVNKSPASISIHPNNAAHIRDIAYMQHIENQINQRQTKGQTKGGSRKQRKQRKQRTRKQRKQRK